MFNILLLDTVYWSKVILLLAVKIKLSVAKDTFRLDYEPVDTVGWVFWPIKPIPDMIYSVFSRTLNLAYLSYFENSLTHLECEKQGNKNKKWMVAADWGLQFCYQHTNADKTGPYFTVWVHCISDFRHLFFIQRPFHIAVEPNCCLCVECLPDDGMYFIVSPKDIVTARQRDEDDHITWLLEHEMFVVSRLYLYLAFSITLSLLLKLCLSSVKNIALLQVLKSFLW